MYADVFTRINQDTFENSISTNNQFITSLHIRRENKRKQVRVFAFLFTKYEISIEHCSVYLSEPYIIQYFVTYGFSVNKKKLG